MSLPRACLGCGRLVRGASRCPACQRGHDRRRGSRQQRGYDREHDQLRAQLVAALDPWAPCPRCRDPLGPDAALLDLMHSDDRRGWLGLGHRRCNRATARSGSPISAGHRTPRRSKFPTHSGGAA